MAELDPAALGSDTMKAVFDRMATLRSYVDDNFSGRDWNLATAMVIEGKAGMQMMGGLGEGRVPQRRQNPRRRFRLLPPSRHAGHGDLQLRPVRHVRGG